VTCDGERTAFANIFLIRRAGTSFYDGLGCVAKIVEKTGATINSTRKFVWLGQEKLEFRDATEAVTQRNYSQGQYVGTTSYFYTRDHLGSIREMFTGGGTVVARYDYDPYGRSTTVLGTTPTDFNFTGLYRHSKSNLDLAVFRSFDPDLGRWLSRDPLKNAELIEGPNVFTYVKNNPIAWTDPDGLFWTYYNPFQSYWNDSDPSRDPAFDAYDAEKRNYPNAIDPFGGDYRHCVASCLSVRRYGPIGVMMVLDWNWTREDDPNDLSANWRGVWRSGCFSETCEETCKKANRRPLSPTPRD
jgi:RHS repeat-associated protein